MLFQKEFWEKEKKRRGPDHPAVKECCRTVLSSVFKYVNPNFKNTKRKPKLLDLGSGNGYFSYQLLSQFDVVVLDYSAFMLEIIPINKKVQADIAYLPFPDKSFDAVLCANTLHHVANVEPCLKEMKRVSKDYVLLIEPNGSCPFIILQSLLIKVERKARKFTRKYIKNQIEKIGLKIVSETSTGIILPKRFPEWSLRLIRPFNKDFFWGLFNVFVTRK